MKSLWLAFLALALIQASRLDSVRYDSYQQQTYRAWISSLWTRVYDWWYGVTPSDCRDLVLYEGGDSSAEEWHFPNFASSGSGSNIDTSYSTSGSSSGDRKNRDALEAFIQSGTADATSSKVWKDTLEEPQGAAQQVKPENDVAATSEFLLDNENFNEDYLYERKPHSSTEDSRS